MKNKYIYQGINDRNSLLFLSCTLWVFIKLQPPTPIFQNIPGSPFSPSGWVLFLRDKQTDLFFSLGKCKNKKAAFVLCVENIYINK